MSVRFKFKNDLDYQPIPCDGYHISVRDLKKSIIRRKKFGKVTDFDLVVTNSQTSHVYNDDDELISKNTTLVVQRAPLTDGKKKVWEEELAQVAPDLIPSSGSGSSFAGIPSLNITASAGDSEEDKISKMMSNSSEMYSEKHWTKYKGQRALPEGSKPPPHWKCSKCLGNHWVSDCPFANNDMKRTTGIPRSFLTHADSNTPGAKINPQGLIVVNEMEKLAYSEKKIEKNPWLLDDEKQTPEVKVSVPAELLCPICGELLSDAVMMPCCAGSACDDCARTGIIESEGSRCPVCGDTANPEELIPYRLFRDKVDRFRNQTGYTKPAPAPAPAPSLVAAKPTLPDIVLPDPNDNNFKFDALVGHRAAPGTRVEPPNLNFSLAPAPASQQPPTAPLILGSPPGRATPATPASKTPPSPGTPTADSPRYEMLGPGPRSPHTPTSTPPRSPSPASSPGRGRRRSGSEPRVSRSPPPAALAAPPPARPMIDTSVPPPMVSAAPPPAMTLLPPGHVLSHAPPPAHYPPPPGHLVPMTSLPPAGPYSAPPPVAVINPSEDPLAAFEAAMRKLDSKKASRGRSPPRAYQDRHRSRSRERYRDYHDGYDRGRDYSPRRRSPGPGYYSPHRRPAKRSPSPAKLGGGPRRRFVADIPPETEQERRDRERYERERADRERRGGREDGRPVRVAPSPPRDFLDRENGGGRADSAPRAREEPPAGTGEHNNRTPSLSPEPGSGHRLQDKENIENTDPASIKEDVAESAPTKLPIIRDERDLDDKAEDGRRHRDDVDRVETDRYREKSRERARGYHDRDRSSRDRDREKYYRERDGRHGESRDRQDRDRHPRDRYGRRSPRDTSRDRDRYREDSRDERRGEAEGKDRPEDRRDEGLDVSVDKNRDGKELDQDRSLNDEDGHKKSKKEKKSKKSKKKNKKKDSDSEDEDKENKKRKKKEKKRKERESLDNNAESDEKEEDDRPSSKSSEHHPEEVEPTQDNAENVEPSPPKPDTSKFINSFSEAVEEKPKLNLPTLVFNDKTVELAPKNGEENGDVATSDPVDNDDLLETELSKWDKDELDNEAENHTTSKEESGPQSILRRALSNMEKDNLVREKKRKSLDGESDDKSEEVTRKKKKKKRENSGDNSDDMEDTEKKKKGKKKKKGNLDIPEKTLKKLLKKNLLKKKALEKLLEDGPKKKKKKRRSGDLSDAESPDSGDDDEERVVRRKSSTNSEEKTEREKSRTKQRQRHDSEEGREVKSSREGNLQIRVENSTTKPKKILTSTIQANLMKLSNGKGHDSSRNSPVRKSIKDRLGPVGGKSQSPSDRNSRERSSQKDVQGRKDTVRDRLGRKESERDSKSKTGDKLGGLPSDLKAWALKTTKPDSKEKIRSRSGSRSKRDRRGKSPVRNARRSKSRERRRSRSRSRDTRRRKRSASSDRKNNGRDRSRDRRKHNESPVKQRRKNHRLASDKDKSFNTDSE